MDPAFNEGLWAQLRECLDHFKDQDPSEADAYLRDLESTRPDLARMLKEIVESQNDHFLSTPPFSPPVGPQSIIQPRGTFQSGQVINQRFEIEHMVGHGGTGEVYRAWDRHRQQPVALKSIRPIFAYDSSELDVLRNELNTATQVSHFNICRLYDITVSSGDSTPSFITMEFLEGENLASRITRAPYSDIEAYPIVEQLVNGLAAAHSAGIVHRDLKPSNVLLVPWQENVRAVITDFGLARQIRNGQDLTTTVSQTIAGTPAYMAPEQLLGERPTEKFDIYSLGVIMFQMLTGQLPFQADSFIAIANLRLNHDAPSPRKFRPDMDRRWEHAIQTCLARDPAVRPESVFEVLSLLNNSPPRKWPRRAILIGTGAAAVIGAYLEFRPKYRNPEAQAAFDRGLLFNQRRTTEGIQNAIQQFRTATKLDPTWADAWSNLADSYAAASNAELIEPVVALRQAQDAAFTAIRLNDHLARSHGSLGWALSLDLDRWPAAESEFLRAIKLDASDPDVRRWYAVHLRKLGRFHEAEQQCRAGLALLHAPDPRIVSELAFLFFTARQRDRFLAQVKEAQSLFPNDSTVEFLVAKSLEIQGRFADALEVMNYSERLGMNRVTVLLLKAGIAISARDPNQASAIVNQVEAIRKSKPIDGLLLAGVYARLGDKDAAFKVIGDSYRVRDSELLSLATSPWMDALRADTRFQDWLTRLHFTAQIMQRMEFSSASFDGAFSQPK